MIVKVPKNRRDGRSSFKDLSRYITAGLGGDAQPPSATSWDRLTRYITQDSVLDALGNDVEKTIAVEIGNVTSLATASAEMYAVAKRNSRAKNPVYHYILSWPESERPATEQIFGAVADTLKALGMSEHQYIAAIHANTDNLHVHVEVNRVHPETFKAAVLGFDHKTLHRAAREIEIKYGWQHDAGIFKVVEVDGRKLIVEDDDYVDADVAVVKGRTDAVRTWTGNESLQEWCASVPAPALRKIVNDDRTTSWQDIHRILHEHGLELRDAGGGGMVVADVSGATTDKPVVVAASKAFRFLKREVLEQRLGPFEPADERAKQAAPTRTYKRDPLKRAQRKLERKAARDDLRARFDQERKVVQEQRRVAMDAVKQMAAEDAKRLARLDDQYRASRQRIKIDSKLSGAQKQQAYMLLKMTTDQARAQLRASIARERADRKGLVPLAVSWRAWVESKALDGDAAAISALRGMAYQEGRERRKAERDGAPGDGSGTSDLATDREDRRFGDEDQVNAIRPANGAASDPYVRAVQNLVWKVSNNGRVNYSFATGGQAFTDEGPRLSFGRKDVSEDALLLSIRYADTKWPGGIRLTGGDMEFKRRAVRMATELGVKVLNVELRALQAQIQDELRAANRAPAGDREAVEAQVRGSDPSARFLSVAGTSGRYRGRVIAQSRDYLAQHVGGHDYVLHEKRALRTAPATGADVTISYRAGKGTATATVLKEKSNRR